MWYVMGVVTHISMITCTGRFSCRLRGVNLIMSTSICSCTPDMSLLCYFQFLNLVLLLKFFTKVTGKGQSTHLVKESLCTALQPIMAIVIITGVICAIQWLNLEIHQLYMWRREDYINARYPKELTSGTSHFQTFLLLGFSLVHLPLSIVLLWWYIVEIQVIYSVNWVLLWCLQRDLKYSILIVRVLRMGCSKLLRICIGETRGGFPGGLDHTSQGA